ncbi:Imm32 family immunity protein [Pedobacter suwonensis]|uniref:Imm32 family immunity protein n=1 Tax=Pedobacter suwonensis TaxID=332999 RepID=UPI0036B4F8CE
MAELKINIPEYAQEKGAVSIWEDGFIIKSEVLNDQIMISGSHAGLISLAKQLLFLAHAETPASCHYHLDEHNSLKSGSKEIVISKI